MNYIGVDLHPGFFVVYRRGENATERTDSYRTDDQGIMSFRRTLSQDDRLAVEATGNANWFLTSISDDVESVTVVNTRRFNEIRTSTNKTDKNDARVLAEYLEKAMLPEARLKTEEHRDLAALARSRDKFVGQRTQCVNRIHAHYISIGVRLDKGSLTTKIGLNSLDLSGLSAAQRFDVEELRESILDLTKKIVKYTKRIEEEATGMPGYRNVNSIKGIGVVGTAIFLSTIGDINDFSNFRHLASYIGIEPTFRQSSNKMHRGPISKKGDPLTRKTLIQCTWATIRYSPYLQSYYQRLRSAKGVGRAIVATARKLLNIIYNTLKNDWVFTDFSKFEKA